jgi:uncharacterized membrane protein YadS
MSQNSDVVVDKGQSRLSDLWTKEDYWAIWIGLTTMFLALFLFVGQFPAEKKAEALAKIDKAEAVQKAEAGKAPFKTLAWHKAQAARKVSFDSPLAKTLNGYMKTPSRWKDSPLPAFYVSKESADAANEKAKPAAAKARAALEKASAAAESAEKAAADAGFQNAELNKEAEAKISAWLKARKADSDAQAKTKSRPVNLFLTLPVLLVTLGIVFAIGIACMGQNVPRFLAGFAGLFAFAVLAYILGQQSDMRHWGLGVEPWAILLGMIIANTVGTPNFIKPALQVEFYIKTGLVLLGCEILLSKILAIGIPGIFVAWVVTPVVLVCTFIFGQKVLKMPSKTLNIVISADMSVCGTSAAIATAAACRAKREELMLSIGISLLFTAIMMIAMPMAIKALGLPEVLGGAWIGGTIDATGAVAAAGAFLGDRAMQVAATVKMIQNVLIGVTAFCVAVYWCAKVDNVEGRKVSVLEIWHRFPKFVLGFLFASVVCSYVSGSLGADMGGALVDSGVIRTVTSPLRGWCFSLSFAAIGLGTNFRDLGQYFKGGKPVILYVCGQSFNMILTLAMAYLMFYVVFPEITAKI